MRHTSLMQHKLQLFQADTQKNGKQSNNHKLATWNAKVSARTPNDNYNNNTITCLNTLLATINRDKLNIQESFSSIIHVVQSILERDYTLMFF